jgi:ribonuclease HI
MTPTRSGSPTSLFPASAEPWPTAFTDGGSRGNPGPAGYGVLVQDAAGRTIAELSEFLGIQTNNFAEYSALLAALDYAVQHNLERLHVISDSELMVKQMRGQYRVQSPDLRPLYEEAQRRAARLRGFRIEHVLRGKNKRADELANQAMDRGMKRPAPARPAVAVPEPANPPARPLRGIVRDGKIALLEGSIPDGTIVLVMPEKALAAQAAQRNPPPRQH